MFKRVYKYISLCAVILLFSIPMIIMRPRSLYSQFFASETIQSADIVLNQIKQMNNVHLSEKETVSLINELQNITITYYGFYKNIEFENNFPIFMLLFQSEDEKSITIIVSENFIYHDRVRYRIIGNNDFIEKLNAYFL